PRSILYRKSPANLDRPCPPFLGRCIVQEGVGLRVQQRMCKRRRLGKIARNRTDLTRSQCPKDALQPLDVERFGETVAQRFIHQRVARRLALRASVVVLTAELLRESRPEQVLCPRSRDVRRDATAGLVPREGQRPRRAPA